MAATRTRRTSPAPTRPASGAQPRADRTRAAIMHEAVRCVVEEGFEAASAKHIAERAGVTWGVIQYHFGDREGLFAAVVESGFEQLRARMAMVEVPQGTSREQVTALVDAAWVAFSTPTSRASLEILIATRGRRDRRTERHLASMAGELTRLGRQLIDDQRPGDAAAVGEVLWATLRGLVLAQMVVADPVESAPTRAALVDVLVAHLGSRRPAPRTRARSRTKDANRA